MSSILMSELLRLRLAGRSGYARWSDLPLYQLPRTHHPHHLPSRFVRSALRAPPPHCSPFYGRVQNDHATTQDQNYLPRALYALPRPSSLYICLSILDNRFHLLFTQRSVRVPPNTTAHRAMQRLTCSAAFHASSTSSPTFLTS